MKLGSVDIKGKLIASFYKCSTNFNGRERQLAMQPHEVQTFFDLTTVHCLLFNFELPCANSSLETIT